MCIRDRYTLYTCYSRASTWLLFQYISIKHVSNPCYSSITFNTFLSSHLDSCWLLPDLLLPLLLLFIVVYWVASTIGSVEQSDNVTSVVVQITILAIRDITVLKHKEMFCESAEVQGNVLLPCTMVYDYRQTQGNIL